MAGSTFGNLYRITTWGESHGKALGCVIDGCPAGLPLNEDDVQVFLDRRKPGQNKFTTKRNEADRVEILSGIFEGKTTGTPISMMIRNTDQHSRDYSEIAKYYRPGHADLTFDAKYGFRDYRGGGRSSGRETIGRVCGGAVASRILETMGIRVNAFVSSIGPVSIAPWNTLSDLDLTHASESPLAMPDAEAEEKAMKYMEECIANHDSCGGSVECVITGMPAGIGETVFDKLDARLAQAIMSIGAVKAVEIGDGTAAALSLGSHNNDQYTLSEDGAPVPAGNRAGGILGGMSSGQEIRLRASFKPTPSIAQPQTALFRDGHTDEVVIHGRHDPIIVSRAAVVVESMAAVTVLDLMMQNMSARLDSLQNFYK